MLPLQTITITTKVTHLPGLSSGAIKKKEETSSIELKTLLMTIKTAFDSLGHSLDSLNIPGNGQQRFVFSQYKIPVLGLHPSPSFVGLKRFRFDAYVIATPNPRAANADLLKWLPQTLAAMRGTLEELDLDFESLKDRCGGQFNAQCFRHKPFHSIVWWENLGLTEHWPAITHLSLTNVQHRRGQVARFIGTNRGTLRSIYLGSWQCSEGPYVSVTFPQARFISDLAAYDNIIRDNGIQITFEGHSSKSKHICKSSYTNVAVPQSFWYWKVTYRELVRDYSSLALRGREIEDCYAYPAEFACKNVVGGKKRDELRSVKEHEEAKKTAQGNKERILRLREGYLA